MAISNFIPIVWSDKIFQANDKAKIFASLANREYEGEIADKGDQVKITELGAITTGAYSGTVTYQELDDASKFLVVDQDYYGAFNNKDLDKVQANVALLGEATRKLGEALADDEDQNIAGLYTEAGINDGSTISVTAITSANVISTISDMNVSFDTNNVPQDNRVMVVPPWFIQKLYLAKVIRDTDNSDVLGNGYMGKIDGWEVYMSNNVVHSSTTWYAPMFFRAGDTIAHANQLTTVESLRLEGSFGDGVRGRMVYGSKVVRPSSLGVVYCSQGSETAI